MCSYGIFLGKIMKNIDLPVIEVPPELRGMSDEEIIKMSEESCSKERRERPSKIERQKLKIARENGQMQKIGAEFAENGVKTEKRRLSASASLPMPKISDFDQKMKSPFANDLAKRKAEAMPMPSFSAPKDTPAAQAPARPAGRVLKSSFSGKMGFSSFKASAVVEKAKEAPAEAPVKRGRGRPRKNPLPTV